MKTNSKLYFNAQPTSDHNDSLNSRILCSPVLSLRTMCTVHYQQMCKGSSCTRTMQLLDKISFEILFNLNSIFLLLIGWKCIRLLICGLFNYAGPTAALIHIKIYEKINMNGK